MHRKKRLKKWIFAGMAVCLLVLCGCSREQDLLLETCSQQEEEIPEQTEPPSVSENKETELYIYICGEVKNREYTP